jgi:hypothetical protein
MEERGRTEKDPTSLEEVQNAHVDAARTDLYGQWEVGQSVCQILRCSNTASTAKALLE